MKSNIVGSSSLGKILRTIIFRISFRYGIRIRKIKLFFGIILFLK